MLAIYCRISKDRPNQKSIKEQKLQGIEFSKNNNFSSYNVYEDVGKSGGGDIASRPDFQRLVLDIESGKITALYVYNQDRLAREETTWFDLASMIQDKKLDFYEGRGERIDLDNPDVFMMHGMKALMDASYKRRTSIKIKAVLDRNAKEGKNKGITPYGYVTDQNGYLIIDEQESEIVKEIFKLSLEGIGTRSIAELLNDRQILTRYNKIAKGTLTNTDKHSKRKTTTKKKDIKWSGNSVRGIIKNTIHKGQRKWNDTYFQVPAILEENYWQKVNDNLSNNYNTGGKVKTHKYLFKGLLRCAKCERNYYGRINVNNGDSHYLCSSKRIKGGSCGNKSIYIDTLDTSIWSWFIIGGAFRSVLLDHVKNYAPNEEITALQLRLDRKLNEVNQIDAKLDKLLDMALNTNLDNDRYNAKEHKLKTEQSKLTREVEQLEKELNYHTNGNDSLEELINSFNDILVGEGDDIEQNIKMAESLDFEHKAEMLRKFIDYVGIDFNSETKHYCLEIFFSIPNLPSYKIYIDKRNTKRRNEEAIQKDRVFIKRKDIYNKEYGFWVVAP